MGNPMMERTLTQQGLDALRSGQTAQAVELLGQATQANPQDFDAALGLGIALAQSQQLGTAAEWLKYAATLRPDSSSAWLNLGQAQLALRNFEEARTALQKALEREPNNQRARQLLSQIPQSAPSFAPLEPTSGEKCPQCGTINLKGYRTCTMCAAPSPKLQAEREAAAAPPKARVPERPGELTEAQQRKILALTVMFCTILVTAQLARILWAMKESSLVTKLVLYNVVAQVAVPFVVALIVLTMYGAVEEGRSVFKSAAVGLFVAIALQIDSLFITPVFGFIIAFIPFGDLIVLGSLIYLATMLALEKAAHTRLDLSYSIAAAITVPTIIVLAVVSIAIGVGVVMTSTKDDVDRAVTGKTTQQKQAEKDFQKLMDQLEKASRGEQPAPLSAPQPMPGR